MLLNEAYQKLQNKKVQFQGDNQNSKMTPTGSSIDANDL